MSHVARNSVFRVSDQAVQSQKMARGLKFRIEEGLFYPCSGNKGAADLCLCFRICRVATVREKSLENEFFSRSGKSQGILILIREI